MNLIGCSDKSPDKIVSLITKKLNSKSIKIILKEPLPDTPSHTYFLFLSILSIKQNLDILNSKAYRNTIGIVFGCPLDLTQYSGIAPLDYVESDDIHIDAFNTIKPSKQVFKRGHTHVEFTGRDFTADVLTRVKSSTGILNKFMTFIYTMPSSTHQTPVKELVCSWLCSKDGEEVLKEKLDKLSLSLPMSKDKKQRLYTIILSEYGFLYKKVLAKTARITNTNSEEFKRIISENNVSAFEVRYIRAIGDKVSKRA